MMSVKHSITIPSFHGQTEIRFATGEVLLVVGPNGVGKSALLHHIYRTLGSEVAVYIPGHRSITFSHGYENLSMSFADMERNFWANTEAFNRYKNQWPEEQFKAVIRRVQNAQTAHNDGIIQRIRNGDNAELLARLQDSPVAKINHAFEVARLPIRFAVSADGFVAQREGAVYSVDQLSDGERAALFIVGAIVTTRSNRVLIIDEPERHLHPSIAAPLISAAVRSREDIAYCFASHDLNLIQNLEAERILFVRNSVLTSIRPELRNFDLLTITNANQIPDDLKKDILGVRDKVLFVEGEPTSLDRALYSVAYPTWKVSPRGGADKVIEAATALAENNELHWIQVVGIVDGDGRDSDERVALKTRKIETLPCPTIENLFFIPEVVTAFCELISELQDGAAHQRIANVNDGIRGVIEANKEEIISRRTAWSINRALSEAKVSVRQVRDEQPEVISIDPEAHRLRIQCELDSFLSGPCDLDQLRQLPIKATRIPAELAKLAGAPTLKWYKQAILRQIEQNTVRGENMLLAMRRFLPVLG